VLHDEANLASGDVRSDVDIVVDRSVADILAETRSRLLAAGIHPIIVYPYDTGGSAAVFLCDESGSRGLHLDLFFDPHGVGRFGIRTNRLLDDRLPGVRWPTVSEPHGAAYLLRKRHWKGDPDRLNDHLLQLRWLNFDPEAGLLVPRVSRAVTRLVEGETPGRFVVPPLHHPLNAIRLARRAFSPIGFWIHILGRSGDLAESLAGRFGAFTVVAQAGRVPTGFARSLRWYIQDVLPVRLTAGVFASWANDSPWIHPDLVVDGVGGLERAARMAIAAMEQRVFR
jgi:hypothetical protein